MLLDPSDAKTLFKIQIALLAFANQRLGVVAEPMADREWRIKVRDAIFSGHRDLFERFADENPIRLSADELDIVRSWRHAVPGTFYVMRQLTRHAIFLSSEKPYIAYGVLALTQPLEELVGPDLPALMKTVLLPFKNTIIYDGLVTNYNMSLGPGIRRSLHDVLKEVKAQHGVVTSLPMSAASTPLEAVAPKAKTRSPAQLKADAGEIVKNIIEMTDRFCRDNLNDEYAVLCGELARKLGRKRPSPLLGGKPNVWAGAIVRTIGWVNFLDDRSQTPHMKLSAVDQAFGVGESTAKGKSKSIRNMLRINQLEPEWTLPSLMDQNPRAWMIELNGFIVDARNVSLEIQQEAFRKGLIPYIPEPAPARPPTTSKQATESAKEPTPPKPEDPNQLKLGF